MTNKEAIEILRANYPDACFGQLREAVDAAIEALKAQNVAGDTISRQAAIDEILKINGYNYSDRANALGLAEFAITTLPSAEPEIIRCGACKWFQCNMRPDGYLPKGVEEFECRHWCGTCDPTDFCSYGERRQHEVR